jgi:septal ring factor EnvC (AmiA/AmiB activator)
VPLVCLGGEVSETVLDSLRHVLSDIDHKLASGKELESDVLSRLDLSEQKFNIQNQLVRTQQTLVRNLADSSRKLESEIGTREVSLVAIGLEVLRLEDARNQIASSCAQGLLVEHRLATWSALEFLFGADSWRDLMARRSLLNRLIVSHRAVLQSVSTTTDTLQLTEQQLMTERQTLEEQRARLALNRRDAERHQNSLERDARALGLSQSGLETELSHIKSNRELLESRRQEVRAAEAAVADLIARIARGEPLAGMSLSLLKGLLPWPISGRILQRFGLQKNKKFDTVTENPGIDIGANPDAQVTAIADGRISSVTWLRGFGNVCILEHAGDFYTVYAKLGQVNLHAGETVTTGQLIGYPGFDPSHEDYRVHFEIWSGKTKLDPVQWLARK